MTMCCVYIGDLNDSDFSWDAGNSGNNIPNRLSPDFPPASQFYNSDYHDWVKAARVDCKQTDFGGWVAKVTKDQLMDYLTKTYSNKTGLPNTEQQVTEVQDFVSQLDEHTQYALVATEL